MEFKDYYKTLDVATDADKAAIKKAYRRLARKYHPDVSTEKDAEQNFKEVSEAYEVLSNDERRAEYDQLRQYRSQGGEFKPPPGWQSQGGGQFESEDFSDFFSSIFGSSFSGHSRNHRGFDSSEDFYSTRGRDIEVDLPVFLEETLNDEQKTIQYNLPHYDESGRVNQVRKTLKVKIPKGTIGGERIRLKGQGAPGFGKGQAGDLYLRVKLMPHPLFDAVGHDLHLTLPVAPWEAALGAKVTVPTLDSKISLNIASGSQTGQRLRVKGHGLPTKTGRGDLFVILKVVMPEKSDEEARGHWEALRDHANFNPRQNLES